MSQLIRFGVSLEKKLLAAFDRHIKRKKYQNRSEAIRDLIRNQLVGEEWGGNNETVGTITLVYDHHQADVLQQLTHHQHEYGRFIISNLHVHLDHDHCLEVIVVKGRSAALVDLANLLIKTRGVKHGQLTMTTTGKSLK
ncbi:MAG: nickel-responsive transcriptional regulator NikR [Nitrospirales bacterium]|nr:nickel-responsive transcriptional regulator NikR [Nitrospira sp.]MDR4499972.1 nickel-responsive transcriptional regulator NikR [Nitrospirales bacterium]